LVENRNIQCSHVSVGTACFADIPEIYYIIMTTWRKELPHYCSQIWTSLRINYY